MNLTKRKVSCTFKRENSLEIQERIYPLPSAPCFVSVISVRSVVNVCLRKYR